MPFGQQGQGTFFHPFHLRQKTANADNPAFCLYIDVFQLSALPFPQK